ncbi:major facilitator superfamily domain-containing protein [Tribonema minus]|uniref:Major facilitator superfamily domain-containing protein n=1 Tax=Tribonema minus TaxID=303371 RepID=A0A835ZG03_9STRA|nr:major facilitator superfamily domain-containing protein [Tribonema minus]
MATPRSNMSVAAALEEGTPLLAPFDVPRPVRASSANASSHAEDDSLCAEGIKNRSVRRSLGAAYMLSMGMCGVVLVALGSTLQELAEHCGTVSTDVGSVFIARGVGAVLGAVGSAQLYRKFNGNAVITCALAALCGALLWLPFVTDVALLHVVFLCLGLSTAITDTGCQIMTRRVHGPSAGPWLGANTVAFGLSGALVPLVSYLPTHSLIAQYALLGFVHEYRIELLVAFMVFWLIGGKVGATAYLTQYVEDTGVIAPACASLLIVVLWAAITLGRCVGIHLQRDATPRALYAQTTLLCVAGAAAAALPLLFPSSAAVLWIAVALWGLFNGPSIGYCYDLNNRATAPSEVGMSVVMFGLNSGASLVPYALAAAWRGAAAAAGGAAAAGARALFAFALVSHALPLPALLAVRALHRRKGYQALPP